MRKQNTLNRLNEIANLFVPGSPPIGPRVRSRTFGLDEDSGITLFGENLEAFEEAVDDLLEKLPRIKGSLSQRQLLEELIPRVRDMKAKNREFTLEDAEAFEKAVCNVPIQKFRVVRRIYGVMLPSNSDPIHIGGFSIGFGSQMFDLNKRGVLLGITLKAEDLPQLYIQCTVEARDRDRAAEIADLRFYKFEQIFRVLIGRRTKWLEVGIINYVGPQSRNRFVFAEDGDFSHTSSWEGALQPVPINDPYFAIPSPPFPRLFQLLSLENNDLERHVVRCAEWTGQAIADENASRNLLK